MVPPQFVFLPSMGNRPRGTQKISLFANGNARRSLLGKRIRYRSVRCFWNVFCLPSPPTHTNRRLSDRNRCKHTGFRSLHYRIQYSIQTTFCQGGICEFMGNGNVFHFSRKQSRQLPTVGWRKLFLQDMRNIFQDRRSISQDMFNISCAVFLCVSVTSIPPMIRANSSTRSSGCNVAMLLSARPSMICLAMR